MLEKLSNKSVRGPGFLVVVPDVHRVEYAEGPRKAVVEIEGETDERGGVNWLLYAETFSGWAPPYEFEKISLVEKERILQNISKSLSMLEMPHTVIE